MTIPGRGDLSPRRKRRDWRRRFAVAAVVLVVAGIAYGGYRAFGGGSPDSPTALPPCPPATATPPAAEQARLTVRNATLRTGLAADVARQLRQRRFHVGKVGNTAFRGKGVATVKYSADRLESARLVAAQFVGASMSEVTGSQVLELDIGPKFQALVPLGRAQAADRAILTTSSPSPSATPSPTCAAVPSATTP